MLIRPASPADLDAVKNITQETIRAVYPKYYTAGAVEFFLSHHNCENITQDIAAGHVFLCIDSVNMPVGTVTVRENEICRLFVLPEYQGKGYGRTLLDYAEASIAGHFDTITLDASLPAKRIYLKRGYRITESRVLPANGDFLCYDVMEKTFCDKTSLKCL